MFSIAYTSISQWFEGHPSRLPQLSQEFNDLDDPARFVKSPIMSCEDFHDQGMQTAWLVEDVKAFSSTPDIASPRDRRLRYSLTHDHDEWLALFFDALGVDRSGFRQMAASHPGETKFSTIGRFTEEIPDYPIADLRQLKF